MAPTAKSLLKPIWIYSMKEIEDLLVKGVDVDIIARELGVPVEWVIGLDLELRGLTQHGYEDNYDDTFGVKQ